MITAKEFLEQRKQQSSSGTTSYSAPQPSTGFISASDFLKQKKIKPTPTVTPKPQRPQPQQQPSIPSWMWTKESGPILSEAVQSLAYGLVPGSRNAVQQMRAGTMTPREMIIPKLALTPEKAASQMEYNKAVLGDIGGIVKGIAGLPLRLGGFLTDIVKSANAIRTGNKNFTSKDLTSYKYPTFVGDIVGEQPSPQKSMAEAVEAGASPLVGLGIGTGQGLFDYLLTKAGVKGGKKMMKRLGPKPVIDPTTGREVKPGTVIGEVPKPEKTVLPKPGKVLEKGTVTSPWTKPVVEELPQRPGTVIEQGRITSPWTKREGPIPASPTTLTKEQVILDQLFREEKPSRVKTFMEKAKGSNPWRFESGRIMGMGPEGNEIVQRSRRANASAIKTAGELRTAIEQTGIAKLSPEEQLNWRASLEGKTIPMNETVSRAVSAWRAIFDTYGKATEVPMLENYFHRELNEQGKAFYRDVKNRGVLEEAIMQQEGLDRIQARKYVDKALRRGSFEHARVLESVPDKFRMNPMEELYRWAADVSRRKGIIENFGKKNEIVDDLISRIGLDKPEKVRWKNQAQAQEYVNRIMGKAEYLSDFEGPLNALQQTMVISKLSPTTTIANMFQPINAYLRYGAREMIEAFRGKNAKQISKEMGLDDIKGKYGEEINAESAATKWMKVIGMEQSESGFVIPRAAVASKAAIMRAFEALRKDPTNVAAKKLLNDHAMYVDDAALARDLLNGHIDPYEMEIGIIEGARQQAFFSTPGERPAWANAPAGRAAYTFKNYMLSQMQILMNAPLHRQIPYLLVIAPVTGLPSMVIRKLIQGKPLPDDPVEWYVESATSGAGTPLDLARSFGITPLNESGYRADPLKWITGSYAAPIDLAHQATQGSARGTAKSAASNLPFQSWYLNRLFPPKQ